MAEGFEVDLPDHDDQRRLSVRRWGSGKAYIREEGRAADALVIHGASDRVARLVEAYNRVIDEREADAAGVRRPSPVLASELVIALEARVRELLPDDSRTAGRVMAAVLHTARLQAERDEASPTWTESWAMDFLVRVANVTPLHAGHVVAVARLLPRTAEGELHGLGPSGQARARALLPATAARGSGTGVWLSDIYGEIRNQMGRASHLGHVGETVADATRRAALLYMLTRAAVTDTPAFAGVEEGL